MHMNLGNNGHIRFHINYIAQDNISTKHMSNRHGCMTRKKKNYDWVWKSIHKNW